MKLSIQLQELGLTGVIRSRQTGESIHFTFDRGRVASIPVEVSIGNFRLEASLELVESHTIFDEIDRALVLRCEKTSFTESSGYTPKALITPAPDPTEPPVNDGSFLKSAAVTGPGTVYKVPVSSDDKKTTAPGSEKESSGRSGGGVGGS